MAGEIICCCICIAGCVFCRTTTGFGCSCCVGCTGGGMRPKLSITEAVVPWTGLWSDMRSQSKENEGASKSQEERFCLGVARYSNSVKGAYA